MMRRRLSFEQAYTDFTKNFKEISVSDIDYLTSRGFTQVKLTDGNFKFVKNVSIACIEIYYAAYTESAKWSANVSFGGKNVEFLSSVSTARAAYTSAISCLQKTANKLLLASDKLSAEI